MKINEILNVGPLKKLEKAGTIPYIIENGMIKMLFMVSSDASYGGPDPMIAKGHVDHGETVEEAAVREAEEELGLKRSNMQSHPWLAWEGELTGMDAKYPFSVYAVEVKSATDFAKPHHETRSTHWMTLEEFESQGRKSQVKIVQAVAKAIQAH